MSTCAQHIQAELGHVSPAMMKTYSHVRRKALEEAATVLEPPDIASWEPQTELQEAPAEADAPVTSQPTSQSDNLEAEVLEIVKEFGSPHWTISATG